MGSMKVVLIKDVDKLGRVGDTVNVADGFARNYLLANGFVSIPGESEAKRAINAKQEKQAARQLTQKDVIIKESKREKRIKRQLKKNNQSKNLTAS